jgi:ubiquinone/menaquinone biosynthesis C-methylase UbiE
MLALPLGDAALAGVVAFYAIVHFSPEELCRALAEMYRVLSPGGRLLLAFHIGERAVKRCWFSVGSESHPAAWSF